MIFGGPIMSTLSEQYEHIKYLAAEILSTEMMYYVYSEKHNFSNAENRLSTSQDGHSEIWKSKLVHLHQV